MRPYPEFVTPHTRLNDTAFVLLSFEGPDDYSRAGGLGSRVTGLAVALSQQGYETHVFFIGSPDAAGHEVTTDGKLHLHRWCQWISRFHAGGVYDGEEGKLHDWNESLPPWLERNVLADLLARHRQVLVLAEEWQTTWSLIQISRRMQDLGYAGRVRCFWNANNSFGFDRIAWSELKNAATVTTVSRFMKHQMWRYDVEARVIPNGIASEWLQSWDRYAVQGLRRLAMDRLLLVKVARWDPDKRWLMAVDGIGALKRLGLRPLLVARGGVEEHGVDVLARVRNLGLVTANITCADNTAHALWRALVNGPQADVIFVKSALSRAQLQCLYRASQAVLANSGVEPFGLVGLEAMACGGVSFLGTTGEDYATHGHDSISIQTADPGELVSHLMYLRTNRAYESGLRHQARKTACRFTWKRVIQSHIAPMLAAEAA